MPELIEEGPHSPNCGCWICDGREPDTRMVFYDVENHVIGKCANCSHPILDGEGTATVHYTCWEAFRSYLNGG